MKQITIAGAKLTDVIYAYVDPVTKEQTAFNITSLLEDPKYKLRPVVTGPVDRDFAATLPAMRGLETHRVKRLIARMKAKVPLEPITLAIMLDGTHLILDGNHRYFAHAAMMRPTIQAKFVPFSLWSKHVVTLPYTATEEDLTTMASGIV